MNVSLSVGFSADRWIVACVNAGGGGGGSIRNPGSADRVSTRRR